MELQHYTASIESYNDLHKKLYSGHLLSCNTNEASKFDHFFSSMDP